MRAAVALALVTALLLALPVAAADHPGSNKGLKGLLPLGVLDGPLDYNLVHRLPTVDAKFAAWEAEYPELVERATIGTTSSGHPLYNIRVTDETVPYDAPPMSADAKHRVYLDGGHHGNEFLGVELVMYYLEDILTKASGGDAEVLAFLATTEIYATPIINVDGNFLDSRKNLNQVDPNRNYDFMWGGDEGSSGEITAGTYRGPEPFSEAETRSNADFQAKIRPDIVVTMHTGIAEFYWPWGWTHDPSPDDEMFVSLEKPFEDATNGRVDAMQGAELYIVTGASDDWAYGVLGASGFTFEVHEDQFIPAYGQPIPDMIAEQLAGLEFIIRNVQRIGAHVEMTETNGTWVATNVGWGAATNVTINSGDQRTLIEHIAPGESVELSFALDGGATWSYPILLINTSKMRTHTLDAPLEAASAGEPSPVPGPGLALVALGVVGAIVLRRRR